MLRKDFVNAWVLGRDLEAIAAGQDDPNLTTVCERLREHYDYPVDSVVIATDLSVAGHVNAHAVRAATAAGYAGFLRSALAKARGEPIPNEAPPPTPKGSSNKPLLLTPSQPTTTLLQLLPIGGGDRPKIEFFAIDATQFEAGGTLTIEIEVGSASASGRFELCVAAPDMPGAMVPEETLRNVGPGGSGVLRKTFERGGRFGLAVLRADRLGDGQSNAFRAVITFQPK